MKIYLIVQTIIRSSQDYNKQIFHAFLFNIRNYSPEVINIILSRVNNFDIKQKTWNICLLLFLL